VNRYLLLIAGFFLLAAGVVPAQSGPASLADVARQNREKQSRETKKPVIVLDDEDLPTAPAGTTYHHESVAAEPVHEANPKSAQPGSSSQAKAGEQKENSSEEPKNARATELKKELESYTAKRDSWKNVEKGYEDKLAGESDDFRRQMYEDALEGSRNNVTLYQHKVDDTQNELNQAQRGASPGQSEPGEQTAAHNGNQL